MGVPPATPTTGLFPIFYVLITFVNSNNAPRSIIIKILKLTALSLTLNYQINIFVSFQNIWRKSSTCSVLQILKEKEGSQRS